MLVLGAGLMGSAAAFDLARSERVSEVGLADVDAEKLQRATEWIKNSKLKIHQTDVARHEESVPLMKGYDAVLSAVPYFFNYSLARAAVHAGTNFCDLGGNHEIVEQELTLDTEAKQRGVTVIPDCGLAPGMTNVLVARAVQQLERIDEVHIRVGGLPQHPKPPLGYKLVFSAHGLINEYVEPARMILNGRVTEVDPLTGIEEISFSEPFEGLEAFYTSGGTSTLINTLYGRVRELDYKTIRYRGHCEKMKTLIDLGFASTEVIDVNGEKIRPRDLLVKLLTERLTDDDRDVVLLRVSVTGEKQGQERQIVYEVIDYFDPATGMTAMMRTTAFPASIIAQMLGRGEITTRGAVPQEACLPAERFVEELAKRGIEIREKT